MSREQHPPDDAVYGGPRPGDDESDEIDDEEVWDHFRRTGCILPGYAHVVAERLAAAHRGRTETDERR